MSAPRGLTDLLQPPFQSMEQADAYLEQVGLGNWLAAEYEVGRTVDWVTEDNLHLSYSHGSTALGLFVAAIRQYSEDGHGPLIQLGLYRLRRQAKADLAQVYRDHCPRQEGRVAARNARREQHAKMVAEE